MNDLPQGKSAGGIARSRALSAERRKAISRQGVIARRERANLPRAICGDDTRPIVIGEIELQCYVLDDETRVLTLRDLQGSIGLSEGGGKEGARKIPALMARLKEKGLDIMDLDARANNPIRFITPRNTLADGYNATILPDICAVLIEAGRRKLLDKRVERLAERAAQLQHGFATLGIIFLVDKVTGYGDLKSANEFSRLVEAYVAKALQPYVSKFPPEYYAEICRLRGLPFDPTSVKRPAYFGHLTNDIVYRRLAPGIWKELKARAKKDEKKSKPHLHRYLTLDIGDPRLRQVLDKVVTTMQLSEDWPHFKMQLEKVLPAFNETMQLPLQLTQDTGKGL